MYASKCENVHLLIDMTSLQTILLNPKQAQLTIPYSPVNKLGRDYKDCQVVIV